MKADPLIEVEPLKSERLYNSKKILPYIPMAKTTLHKWSKEGKFPSPVMIGGTNYWRSDDVISWLKDPVKWMAKQKMKMEVI